MERGDLAAVAIGLLLVILLTAFLTLNGIPVPAPPSPAATPTPTHRVPPRQVTPPPVTMPTAVPTEFPATSRATTRRIFYTSEYYLLPVRFLPSDMELYGFSDVEWQYNRSVVFAYVEENHGGITETFTVPYPVWRITSTVFSTGTPEKARFRMILVDETTGQILEGAEIQYPGSVTKTVVAKERPLYMVIEAVNVERFMITLEAPSAFVQ
jgi:hypothetical protein